uniref:Uncharacterized protein n=1 Tax=Serinus canaria TaxID=9135 RepID=A0A8C9NTX5_SERCA
PDPDPKGGTSPWNSGESPGNGPWNCRTPLGNGPWNCRTPLGKGPWNCGDSPWEWPLELWGLPLGMAPGILWKR